MLSVASTSKLPPAQPSPSYVLRGHTAQISVLTFSLDGNSLYSGDVDGWVSVWDLKTFRPRLFWQAHEAGILSIAEWNEGFLTHGRDNKIHYFLTPIVPPSITRTPATNVPNAKSPTPLMPEWSMDVNSMAFSKMAILRLSDGTAVIAVPALTKDEMVDIFHIPSLTRVHRSIGAGLFPMGDKTGTIMALVLFVDPPLTSPPSTSSTSSPQKLHLLAGYEDGRVAHFVYEGSETSAFDPPTSKRDESEGWSLIWDEKGHREALMSIALAPDQKTCWSVGADHYLCRYNLTDDVSTLKKNNTTRLIKYETTAPGRSTISIRDDGKLLAVAGWDGETRLYSPKSGEALAVLSYHRVSLHALAFGRSTTIQAENSGSEDEIEQGDLAVELGTKGRDWLAVGGKDDRISLWEVYPRNI